MSIKKYPPDPWDRIYKKAYRLVMKSLATKGRFVYDPDLYEIGTGVQYVLWKLYAAKVIYVRDKPIPRGWWKRKTVWRAT